MSAIVRIRRWYGSGPSQDDITNQNCRVNACDDSSTNETTHAIPVPSSGTNLSFWCCTRLYVSSNPSSSLVNNIRWFTGTNNLGTGINIKVGLASSYTQASGTQSVSGNILNSTNYPTLLSATTNAFLYTFGSPLMVSGSTSSTGDVGDFVVYQYEIATTASAGASNQETFYFAYDMS